ncbi:hypothetical protein BWD09_02355 [Neisseria dentiae]|uniref:LysM domain-containing protein n=1 Tax=Neisseria dentiae TaxID=194197 RepID=A0A1X3DFS4_9NEIS|nr:FimV/HubP family polar landmark protein [Neisseria dentiae]OSI18625.1 hypothetical protein BWD09_02355 [Neisseria dentiae]
MNVQSNLGEPFSGTVTVTGEEARILLNGGNASLSDGSLRASVRKSGNNAVINIRSNAPVNDPVLVFQVGVGSQSRQYTAIIDPADYPAESSGSAGTQPESRTQTAPAQTDETGTRAETQQSAAARAKLKAKKTQEQQARKEQQKAAAAAREKLREQAAAERKSEPPRGNYKVSRGETLTSIANQIRPSGLSVHETIAAIMTANPEIFPTRNANQILAGRVLNIPSSEELKRLAKQPAPAAQEQAAQASQPDTAASAPAGTAATASAPASAPAADTTTAAASAAPQASEPATAAASSTASEPAATSSPAATPQPAQPASEESSGLWRWLLFAGLGTIALWLLLKLAGKKKAAVESTTEGGKEIIAKDTDSDDEYETLESAPETEIRTHQPAAYPSGEAKSSAGTTAAAATVTAAAAAATAAATKTEDDGLDVEDDFDDIFFSEAEAAPVEKTESNFNLDLGSIDREQGGIVSGALTQDEETQKREYADWDNIESTESVYEPETESEFQHVAVEFNAGEDADSNQETTVIAESEPSDSAKADDDASLEFYTGQAEDAVTGQAAPDGEEQVEELSLVQIETTTAPESVAETVEIDTLSFTDEADAAAPAAETITEQPPITIEIAEDAEPETADHVSESTVGAIETAPAEEPAVTEATTESAWTAATPQDDGFAFQDGEDFGTTVNLSTDDAETIEWESINVEGDSRSDDGGFISESVGMTAPLEAKYELAQMYVEIGDPEAARETLQELLEESSGTILEKTKTMLAELDK